LKLLLIIIFLYEQIRLGQETSIFWAYSLTHHTEPILTACIGDMVVSLYTLVIFLTLSTYTSGSYLSDVRF